jgi:ankyrin repeat protein
MYGRNDIANYILENHNFNLECDIDDLFNLIHYVCYYDNIFLLDKLIKKNININTTNKYNDTALTICSKDDKYEFVNILLENGADINHINEIGNTLMHYACMNNSDCVFKFRIKNISQI